MYVLLLLMIVDFIGFIEWFSILDCCWIEKCFVGEGEVNKGGVVERRGGGRGGVDGRLVVVEVVRV